ncbi:HET domain-containing protein [Fusarium keratoplasticum]|uniref:HET domain-containing protein n=1 Tax=Fusarium keratoplasticum TaxID=1328300 RepID=A0ACC0QZH9_9HYPO|nr:HET domain-containing protein [Fusarium keratoplasticum]KAI8670529.1 HET domain-containing protein [Fusarium keratoplasticum]
MAESTDPTIAVPNLYHPLDPDIHDLRLLEIYPSEDSDSPIQAKIFPCRFEDVRGQFIPLSYVWGDPTDTETIIINEIPKKVTKNLALFLRQIRTILPKILAPISWGKPALFWADAICINQDDTEERNHQVQFMGSIYGSAPVVLAWLGQAEDSHLVANIIGAFATWMKTCGKKAPNSAGHRVRDPNCDGWMERYPEFWAFSDQTNPYWDAIMRLLHLPYWGRTWIFQEMTLPANVMLIYDSALIMLSSLVALIIWIVEFTARDRDASDFPFLEQENYQALRRMLQFASRTAVASITEPLKARGQLATQQCPTLTLVPALATLCASDPRDRIFGLLGVMDTDLVADYNKPTIQVYTEFVSAWMSEVQDLNFLIHACCIHHREGQPGLPSWAPDWGAISWAVNASIPHGKDFSRFWREEIFGDVKFEDPNEPDVANWEDAGAALQWVSEYHSPEAQSVHMQLIYPLAFSIKFLTNNNYMGVASSAEVGDKVVVLGGCDVPVLLRPKDGHYEHISACFVAGLMDGEAKDMVDRGEAKLETFDIH